jgi:uncharacterized protein YbaP (TraB family)
MIWRKFAIAIATLAMSAAVPLAHAQPASTEKPPGLPMWVIRDADSTIYITGTVHRLRDGMEWRSPKLEAAMAESKELWLELGEIADPGGLDEALHPVLEAFAAYDGTPLSQLLTVDENAALHAALARVGAPRRVFDNLDRMEPWYATYALGMTQLMGSEYDEANAIDDGLARMALAHGIPVKGMEDIEDQIELMTGMEIEDQVEELRFALKAPPGVGQQMQRVGDLAYGSWIKGETHMVEALVAMMHIGSSVGGIDTDALLIYRNENWADVVEDILKGSGVSFIGVGAAHLVGPGSLQDILAERGIKTKRY